MSMFKQLELSFFLFALASSIDSNDQIQCNQLISWSRIKTVSKIRSLIPRLVFPATIFLDCVDGGFASPDLRDKRETRKSYIPLPNGLAFRVISWRLSAAKPCDLTPQPPTLIRLFHTKSLSACRHFRCPFGYR